jgi:glycosyltransferase involved in cell wall biosynthesis
LRVAVEPHERICPAPPIPRSPPGPRRRPACIATIGAIDRDKGFDVLVACARVSRAHRLPVRFVVIGYTCADSRARRAGLTVTGRYEEEELAGRLAVVDPDLVFISSVVPETFCYTLGAALRSGRPVAAFDLGAVAERLRAAERGALLPLSLATDPAALVAALCAVIETAAPTPPITGARAVRP